MTDHEITLLCARAMGYPIRLSSLHGMTPYDPVQIGLGTFYDPLHDDAQAMALVKKFKIDIVSLFRHEPKGHWWTARATVSGWEKTEDSDLNRAICECVAKMMEAKP